MRKIERLRADHPMWGKRKLAVLLRREEIDVSVSMVGRILTKLMARGVVTPVPMLRRKLGPRRLRIVGQRHAKRLPKGMKPIRPGELVQIDTLFVNVAPDKAVKHFTAYDPVAKWTVALVAGRATARCAAALLDKLIAEVPFRIEGIQVDGGSEFRPSSRTHAESATCASSSCRRSGLSSTATSNAPKARGDTSSTASKTSRPASNRSSSASTPSPIASITQGLTKHLAISPQPSTSQPSARRSPRLTWAELGQCLDRRGPTT